MGRTAKLLDDPAHAFGSIATVLNATDLTVLNLETAITDRGTAQSKEFHFRAPPAAFDALRAAGVDAVTFANNHVLDYGQVGLADTLAAANAAQFPYFGIGVNAAAAWAPLVRTVGGARLAFIGVSQVHELASAWVATDTRPGQANAIDENRTLAAIRSAKTSADIVIVFMHWGTEGNGCPNPEQKALAKKMAAAGANIILGAHAHTLQGSGWLGHTFVAYGMANFLWYSLPVVLDVVQHPDRRAAADPAPGWRCRCAGNRPVPAGGGLGYRPAGAAHGCRQGARRAVVRQPARLRRPDRRPDLMTWEGRRRRAAQLTGAPLMPVTDGVDQPFGRDSIACNDQLLPSGSRK